MASKIVRCSFVILLALLFRQIVSADPVTLTPGSSLNVAYEIYNGTPRVGGNQVTYTLSTDGAKLTVDFVNTSAPDSNQYQNQVFFRIGAVPSSSSITTLPAGVQWNINITPVPGGAGDTTVIMLPPAIPPGNGFEFVVNNSLSPNQRGSAVFTFGTPLQSLTLDPLFNYMISPFQSSTGTLSININQTTVVSSILTTGATPTPSPAAVPEPATALMLATGLTALTTRMSRRRKAKNAANAE